MTRRALAAALLLAVVFLLIGYTLGRAATPRPAQEIPASAFSAVSVAEVPRREPDPERTWTPQWTPAPSPSPEPSPPLQAAPGHSISDAKAYARRVLGAAQYACLDAIVIHESRWNPLARNPVSGAFGIPQALHGLTSTDPVTQVKWMLDYVARRYGTACLAWAHVEAFGWY